LKNRYTSEKPEGQMGQTDTGGIDLSENADIMDEVMKWS